MIEPREYARVALVPPSWVELLVGVDAYTETSDLTIMRQPGGGSFSICATRDAWSIQFAVKAHVFREFVARVYDLCDADNDMTETKR